jgi:hypothetical protein
MPRKINSEVVSTTIDSILEYNEDIRDLGGSVALMTGADMDMFRKGLVRHINTLMELTALLATEYTNADKFAIATKGLFNTASSQIKSLATYRIPEAERAKKLAAQWKKIHDLYKTVDAK